MAELVKIADQVISLDMVCNAYWVGSSRYVIQLVGGYAATFEHAQAGIAEADLLNFANLGYQTTQERTP